MPDVKLATNATDPTDLYRISFNVEFINQTSHLTESDIELSSGTIENLQLNPLEKFTFAGPGNNIGEFFEPTGISSDSSGNIYVSDTFNNRIQVFTNDGNYIRTIGSVGDSINQIHGPHGITISHSDELYITDSNNHRIQVFDSDGNHIRTFGSQGTADGEFQFPLSITSDPSGNVYVTEVGASNRHRIQVFDSDGNHIRTFGERGTTDGQINDLRGIALDSSGNLYVSDSINHRIHVFTTDGTYIRSFGSQGTADGEFRHPHDVKIDPYDNIYITDNAGKGYRVQIFTTDGTYIRTFGDADTRRPIGDPGTPIVTLDPFGKLYLLDNEISIIRVFDLGSYSFDVLNPADQSTLSVTIPADPVRDLPGSGNVGSNIVRLFVDRESDELVTFPIVTLSTTASSPTNLSTIPFNADFNGVVTGFTASEISVSSGTVENLKRVTSTFGSQGTDDGEFQYPRGIAVDSSGNIYVTDSENNRIQRYYPDGIHRLTFGSEGTADGQFDTPYGIALDSSGNLYVADSNNHRIQVFANDGTHIRTFGSQGAADGQFDTPYGIALDPSGNLYVADSNNHRIQILDNEGSHISSFGSRGSAQGEFDFPREIALDPSGNLYVADSNNHRIQVFESDGTHIRTFGSQGAANGQFDNPHDIEVDPSGNIYVADSNLDRVQVFESDGTHIRTFGNQGTADGEFQDPRGIALDPSGNIYVADSGNHRIQMFNMGLYSFDVVNPADQEALSVAIPADSAQDISGNGNTASDTLALLVDRALPAVTLSTTASSPTNLSAIPFTADFGEQVTGFTESDISVSSGTVENLENIILSKFTFGSHGTAAGQFDTPSGAVYSSGNIYVADSRNNRIQVFANDGTHIRTFGSQGTADGEFDFPHDIEVDPSGNLYVSDFLNHRIQVFANDGTYIRTFGSQGTDDGEFNLPRAIALDSFGNIYVADSFNHRIQVFTNDGTHIRTFGSQGAANGQFDNPHDIEVDPSGNIYVADSNNHRIQVFANDGTHIRTFGSQGAANGQFDNPHDIEVDPSGNIYVADSNNHRIQILDNKGSHISSFGSRGSAQGEFDFPRAIALDSFGNLYVVDSGNHRIQMFNMGLYSFDVVNPADQEALSVAIPAGSVQDLSGNDNIASDTVRLLIDTTLYTVELSTTASSPTNLSAIPFTADFSEQVTGFTESDISVSSGTVENLEQVISSQLTIGGTSRGQDNGQFDLPSDVAVDQFGKIYISDLNNHRIQVFESDGTHSFTFGMSGRNNGQFDLPYHIALDSFGKIYISDLNNHRIQVFESDGTHIRTFGSEGTADGEFNLPRGIVLDPSGNIYVADSNNHRIQVFANDGTHIRTFGSQGAANGQFDTPYGIVLDPSGNIYVADSGNHRIQVFESDGTHIRTFGSQGAANGQFDNPHDIEVDPSGNIYVADSNLDRVQVFANDGTHIRTFGNQGTADGEFQDPRGIALDPYGNLYVADSFNHRIQMFNMGLYSFDVVNPADQSTLSVAIPADSAQGISGHGNIASDTLALLVDRALPAVTLSTTASSPTNLSVIPFTADFGEEVTGFTESDISVSSGTVENLEQIASELYSFDVVNPADQETFSVDIPAGSVQDLSGNDNIASNTLALFVDRALPTVTLSTTASNPTNLSVIPFNVNFREQVIGFTESDISVSSGTVENLKQIILKVTFGDQGSASGEFDLPHNMVFDSSGNIYVADSNLDRVQVFESDGTHIRTFGERGTADGEFRFPRGIALDPSGNLYVSDSLNHRIQVFANDGTHIRSFGSQGTADGEFQDPRGIAVDSSGNLYVTDSLNHRIQVFANDDTHIRSFGSQGTADGEFQDPRGIAVDSSGNIYVADSLNHRIQVFANDGTHIRTFGERGTADGQFSDPHDVTLDSFGNIYVADSNNHRIQIFTNDGTHIRTFGERGIANGQFLTPYGVAVDQYGSLYVADTFNHRIQVFNMGLYSFDVLNPADQETFSVAIPAGSVQDLSGNDNIASDTLNLFVGIPPAVSRGSSSSGDTTPPSFTTSFDEGTNTIVINDVGIAPAPFKIDHTLDSPIIMPTGEQARFSFTLYDNRSWEDIAHFEICLIPQVSNRDSVCNTDTKIIWDKNTSDNELDVIDPNELIASAKIDTTEVSPRVATFNFDVIFDRPMDKSDVQLYIWDSKRNALVFTVQNALNVIDGTTGSAPDTSDSNTVNDAYQNNETLLPCHAGELLLDDGTCMDPEPGTFVCSDNDVMNYDGTCMASSQYQTFDDVLASWADYSSTSASDAELLSSLGIQVDSDVSLPKWIKKYLGEWAYKNEISYDHFKIALSYFADNLK